jgi:hypothetical protein
MLLTYSRSCAEVAGRSATLARFFRLIVTSLVG